MLRITRVETAAGPSLKLEGKLLAPWVAELRSACRMPENKPGKLQLDLSAVAYVDADGVKLLEELVASGVAVVHCSPFVSALFNRETSR